MAFLPSMTNNRNAYDTQKSEFIKECHFRETNALVGHIAEAPKGSAHSKSSQEKKKPSSSSCNHSQGLSPPAKSKATLPRTYTPDVPQQLSVRLWSTINPTHSPRRCQTESSESYLPSPRTAAVDKSCFRKRDDFTRYTEAKYLSQAIAR
eukprot:Rmarinus@m.8483